MSPFLDETDDHVRSVEKMAFSSKYHADTESVRCLDGRVIADGTAWLDDDRDPGLPRGLYHVGKREKRVGRQHRSARARQ